ncbi:MAG: pyridoxine 5'-phosphate synthase [Pyrinomonadaceae bacterium]
MTKRLNVNIDHVATVRQARRASEPSLIAAAMLCEHSGADGITIHLRGDRRHIQDADLFLLKQTVTTYLNVEMATDEEMIAIAIQAQPDAVTLVAENPQEITTEGGLDVRSSLAAVRRAIERLRAANIIASVFIDPDRDQIAAAHEACAQQVELCTALYSEHAKHHARAAQRQKEWRRLGEAAELAASQYDLSVAAGHGLTYRNVGAVATIEHITEFNIGHNIVARAVLVGMERAVQEMRDAVHQRRAW